jgi:predicted nucleic acid-binding Zn ribbon protein
MSMATEPVPIHEALTGVVKSLRGPGSTRPGAVPALAMGGVFGRWDEVVGAAVAAHVQPVKLDGDRLVVEVDDPAWATQLKFLEADLRERLREATGAEIRQFEIRVKRT